MDAATVKVLLQSHLADCEFHVQGEGSNYDITAIGNVFEGLRPVRKQQMVYAALSLTPAGGTGDLAIVLLGALLGLVGGLILRQGILVCGTLPTWNIAGFKFRRIARPKDPKPAIGLLPPH